MQGKHQVFVAVRWTFLSFAFLPMLLVSGSAQAADNDYRLGPQDKIRVMAYEWRASRDEIFEWSALNDEFTVSAAGTLSLPFIGEIRAEGLSPGEIAKLIADRLRMQTGLGREPDTSVEIVQFRPFYIVGDVERPGEFPYRPGVTVLQALSIAGGVQRFSGQGLVRLERDAISGRGELHLFSMQIRSLLARRARLRAEVKRSETIEFPPELRERQNDASVSLLMQQEQLIFEARRDAFTTQMYALEHLKSYLEKEAVSLNAQVAIEDTQLRLVNKELQSVSSLVDKGLAVVPRQLSLERTAAQIEGDRLRIGTSLLKAMQEISRTDITIIELRNKWNNDVSVELRETQAKLEELERKSDTSEQLLYEAEVIAPQFLARLERTRKVQPIYTIVRRLGTRTSELAASETTPVEPGDTIKVEVPVPLLDRPSATGALSESAGATKSAAAPRLQKEQSAPEISTR